MFLVEVTAVSAVLVVITVVVVITSVVVVVDGCDTEGRIGPAGAGLSG